MSAINEIENAIELLAKQISANVEAHEAINNASPQAIFDLAQAWALLRDRK